MDFLERQGEKLTRSGPEWRWKRHDSVTVRGNEWFRHSRKEGGHAIDFVQEFYNVSFPEAVQWLLGGEAGVEWNQTSKSAPAPKKDFALPEVNSDMRRVFAYLIKQRFIDRDVLSHFAHEKLIYEDKEYHNAVFVGLDEKGIARYAHKRGTYTQGEPYKEDKCYPAIATIARELKLSRSTGKRALADLEKSGYHRKEQRWRENGGKSSNMFYLKKVDSS